MRVWISGRQSSQDAFQLHFIKDSVLDRLAKAVHFIDAPIDTHHRPQGVLTCGHFGEAQIGIDDPLRIRLTGCVFPGT